MRVAVTNQFRFVAGGAETYLRSLLPQLGLRGIEVGLWYETDVQAQREMIDLPNGSPVHCVERLGLASAKSTLADWKPDLIYNQSDPQQEWERFLFATAPIVRFVHSYEGTCISGNKSWKFPIRRSCDREFGWQCMAHYFPHRCGGLSPLSMLRSYSLQSRRLESLRECASILTASVHMRDEYLKHGFGPDQVKVAGLYVPDRPIPALESLVSPDLDELRLLFCGRMIWLKGGQLFLDALPLLTKRINRPLQISFLGDGSDRREWERRAASLNANYPQLRIQFLKWGSREECQTMYRQHHLLVVPSIWPEPFGLIGPEAAQHGLPAVAFATGGIGDWLIDGVNGYLAKANPPTAAALAEAIVKATSDRAHYLQLRQAALCVAQRFSLDRHLQILLPTFEAAAKARRFPSL